jgi:hypothetical protein
MNEEAAVSPAMSINEGLQVFDQFLKAVTEALVEAEENSCQKFRNRISAVSRTIPIYFESEGEEFGMSREKISQLASLT